MLIEKVFQSVILIIDYQDNEKLSHLIQSNLSTALNCQLTHFPKGDLSNWK